MKRKLKRLGLVVLIMIPITACIGIHYVAPYAIIKPAKVHLDIVPKDYGVTSEPIQITTDDAVQLNGHFIPSAIATTRGVLIFVHGVGGCKEHFVPLAAKVAQQGIASIVFDGRAHGESGGAFCTYGFYEKNDVKNVVDYLLSKCIDVPIGIWGKSLGGAIALQAMQHDKRIGFGISESTFTDLDQIVFDYKKRILKGVGVRVVSDYALERAGEIANFNPDQVKPIQSVAQIEQPVLIVHGDADKNISFAYGKALYKHLKTEDKQWHPVKGGGHLNISQKGGSAYEEAVFSFINAHINP